MPERAAGWVPVPSFVLGSLFWALLLATPLLAPNAYVVSLVNVALINLVLIASLNLLVGSCGLISLSHAGFFGLGAYLSGILSLRTGLPPLAGLPLAATGAFVVAGLVGMPALRLRGHYLAMVTLGWNAIIVVGLNTLVGLTGGPNGLLGVRPFALGSWVLASDAAALPLVWACAAATMLLIRNIRLSRQGRAMRAVADSELGAAALGVDTFRIKLATFAVSGGLAGLAGSLYMHVNQFASPETFGVAASIMLLVMVAVGGRGSFWGPAIAAAIYTAVPPLLSGVEDYELLVFGLAMLLVLIVLPGGLASVPVLLRRQIRR